MLIFFDKIINRVRQAYRKRCFLKYTHTKHKQFTLVGKVHLINKSVSIGKNVTIYPDVTFWGDGKIVVGDGSSIGQGTIIYSSKENGGLTIGKDTHISAYCYIIDMDHGTKAGELIKEQMNIYEPVVIGDDVWIAAGCKILRGSKICNGSVIGAGAVVKGTIPENTIAVGVPAKVIKSRE